MEVSIIIPTRNRIRYLERTLLKYNNQTVKDFEMIVIVDGTEDNTVNILKKLSKKLNYPLRYSIYHNKGGTSRARNKGVRMANGKYVLFVGDDCYPNKNLIKEHLKILTPYNACLGFIDWHNPNEFMRWSSPKGAQFRYNWIHNPQRVNWYNFYGSNISYPRKWHEYEQFDEEYFKDAAVEDSELGYRFYKRDFRTILNMNAVVYHDHLYNLKSFIKRTERIGYYTWKMVEKYKRNGDKKAVFTISLRCFPFMFLPFGLYLFKYSALILSKLIRPATFLLFVRKKYWFFTICYHFAIGLQNGRRR